MGRGVGSDPGMVPARRGAGNLVRPTEVIAHQKVGPDELRAIEDAQRRGVLGWEVDGHGCRELAADTSRPLALRLLPLPVALEAWCRDRLDFDHLMEVLGSRRAPPEPAFTAFPELAELPV